ncbi:MAG: hypothetical protein IPP12_14010 [Nitrospira sp.]|nr:hypothetical protein [Nitrospira sp.]
MGSSDTWKNGQAYWPDLLASDQSVDDFDIYRIDYETGVLTGAPISKIRQSFAQAMDAARHMGNYKTIQFIAHSLGGNIVRDYLVYIKTGMGHGALNQFRQVFLLASPGEGSYLSQIPKIVMNHPQLRILTPLTNNDYLGLLNDTWGQLLGKRDRFSCPSISIKVAYEQLPVPPLGIIVTEESASSFTLSAKGYLDKKGFNRNHIDIVKPTGFNDPVYQWVKQGVLDCAAGHPNGPCPKWDSLTPFCRNPPMGL